MHSLAWKTLVVISWLVVATSGASLPEDNSAFSRNKELQNQLDFLTSGNNEETSPEVPFDHFSGSGEIQTISSTGDLEPRLDNPNYFEGDLNIPREQIMGAYSHHTLPSGREKRGAINDRRWPGGMVYYEFHSSVNSSIKQNIQEAIEEYKTKTCLRFKERNRAPCIQFTTKGMDCSSSSVGMEGGQQTITLPGRCGMHGVIVHEIGHAIGLWHEQSRPDRDLHVNIHWENIVPKRRSQFEKRDNIDYQGEEYDYESVMHYYEKAFSSNNKKTITRKNSQMSIVSTAHLSESDVAQINRMYKCPSQGFYGKLAVKMIRAHDLPNTDGWWRNGKPDPYAKVIAYDTAQNYQQSYTRSIPDNNNPFWNQILYFRYRTWRYFTITILDDDSGRDDEIISIQTVWVQPTCSSGSRKFCTSSTQCVYYEYRLDNANNCAPNPCARGTCIDKACDFICQCPLYYYGKKCESYYRPPTPTPQSPRNPNRNPNPFRPVPSEMV